MSEIPDDLLFSEEHEYLKPTDEENVYLIGVTDYAQGELGDVVFLELPGIGEHFDRMDVFGTIEAVKAVSDLFAPIGGEILEINQALDEDPALVNSDPYGEGWMVRMRIADTGELDALLSAEEYREIVGD